MDSLGRTVLYFASEAADPATRRRMRQIAGEGLTPIGIVFHRPRSETSFAPPWPSIDLGAMTDGDYLSRFWPLLRGLLRLLKHRRTLRGATVVFARNLDMLLLACCARWMGLHAAPIVYDVFDVRAVLLGRDAAARVLRRCERWLLTQSSLLVVSAPDFVAAYFRPKLGYEGPWRLVENRVDLSLLSDQEMRQRWKTAAKSRDRTGKTFTIGWVGALRCRRSAELLRAIADLAPDLRIQISGRPNFCDDTAFAGLFAGSANVIWTGAYTFPDGLEAVYRDVDLNWCLDLPDDGMTGRWLLPNRLYEGGLFGVPALAGAGSAVAQRVEALGHGWIVEPDAKAIVHALRTQVLPSYAMVKARAASLSGDFIEDHDLAPVFAALDVGGEALG